MYVYIYINIHIHIHIYSERGVLLEAKAVQLAAVTVCTVRSSSYLCISI